jgi:hypothetical protein
VVLLTPDDDLFKRHEVRRRRTELFIAITVGVAARTLDRT